MEQNDNTINPIDINLYDRQVRTYGVDALKKMTTSSILIIGLDQGLATEIGKNLALGGIRNIYLLDSNPVDSTDLTTGFYYSQDSIGKPRSECLKHRLQELNPYVTVHSVDSINQNQNVTIVVNQSVESVNHISNHCRQSGTKLIVLYSKGASGVVFVDASASHVVTDATGEAIEHVQVGSIDSEGKVKCASNSSHDFQSGDSIRFENLEGVNVEQFNKEWKIKVINRTQFQLEDWTESEPHNFVNGTVVHIKKPVTITHQPWDIQSKLDSNVSFDMEHSRKLVTTYLQMFTNNLVHTMPFIWSESNDSWMETNQISLREQARMFAYELMPVVSLMGSIVASEAVKLVTNKYLPISQWFTWTDPTIVPTAMPNYVDAKTTYGVLYGVELENRLLQSRWFLVGSGAIGCEHLKNLALMNVGEVILTDPDTIEKSNLNRQFLFRSEHIGKPKSVTAASMIQTIRPEIKITPHLQKVGPDNLEFTNGIMNSNITGVLNALDNIAARRFVDEQCFKFGVALFESGTTGTKGNTQPVIPFVTETYSNSSDPEQEKSFPICTIKSFPNEIAHTIHWAMDQFEFFNRAPASLNKWISNEEYVDSLGQVERVICLDDINQYTVKYPTQQSGLIGCAEWAVDMFTENYNNSIIQLLHTFGPTHETSPGVLFWSAGKRCPKPIEFDSTNNLHLDYVEATTHLLARTSGLDDHFTREELVQMIANYKPAQFVPKDIKIASNDSEIEKVADSEYKQIPVGARTDFKPVYVSQEFEKDDDTNWHIDWVNAASNMRAMNYSIPSVDRQQTKGIAGRIIPAIATTTSAVSGLILIEMLKYLIGFAKVETYRSTFINLAEPILLYSEPISAPKIEVAGVQMNSWTKFEYINNTTLGDFKRYYENMFKTTISMIVIGTSMAYADFIGNVGNLDVKLSDIIFNTLGSHVSDVTFTLGADNDIDLPAINVKIC